MKKGYLIILVLMLAIRGFAQMYTFERDEHEYNPIQDATQVSGSEPWSDTIYHIPIGFDFTFYGKRFTSCYLQQGNLYFDLPLDENDPLDTAYIFYSFRYNISDPGSDSTGSLSNISFKTSGDPGNRILMIEYTNALVETDIEATCYADFQIWLYEYNGTLEFRYGPVSYVEGKGVFQYLGVGMLRYIEVDSLQVIRQTRLRGVSNILLIEEEDPNILVRIIPEENDIYRFLYDRDIILNNYVDPTLISGLGHNHYHLNSIGEISYPDGFLPEALLGHNAQRDFEWAERFILSDSAVLKGFVSQHYGYASNDDSVYYSIYLPGHDKLPGDAIQTRKVSFRDVNLSGDLNIFGIKNPIILRDTFFIAFGVPPYTDYSSDCIGIFYTLADAYKTVNYDYGRTAARWMDGRWYDIYASRYMNQYSTQLVHSEDLIHLSLTPMVNFFTGNLDPVEDQLKSVGRTQAVNTYVQMKEVSLYPHFPNPAADYLNIRFELEKSSLALIEIYSLNGSKVYQETIYGTAGCQIIHTINISSWGSGEYIYILRVGSMRISSGFIKL